jgi:hypothetical protein
VVEAWLASEGADPELCRQVSGLVKLHEWGGTPEADLLEAADSISFLEVNAEHAERWLHEPGQSRARIAAQFEWMYERISLERARQLARPFYERARTIVAGWGECSGAGEAGDFAGS